ncbi:MAG: energy transducer TonB [Balneolia bacterium]|nr:energy transducer TonB [Balneolia bacterium]
MHIFKQIVCLHALLLIVALGLQSCASSESARVSDEEHIEFVKSEDVSDIEFRPAEIVGGQIAFYNELRYPDRSKERGSQGRVLLSYTVSELGILERVEVEESSGDRALDRAAVRAFEQMRFLPAVHNGERVPIDLLYPVPFLLN